MKYRIVKLNNGRYMVHVNYETSKFSDWLTESSTEFRWLWQARKYLNYWKKFREKRDAIKSGREVKEIVEEL